MKKKVLIVEDEPILALELTEDLTRAGYEVLPVLTDGDRVLSVVLQHHPDLILMDIKIYGFRDGIEAAKRIRPHSTTPIVYLSSKPYTEVKDRVAGTAPAWYLEKPYEGAILLSTMQRVLGQDQNLKSP